MVSIAEDQASGARGARRRQESRRRLLAAARKLFVERGYHATRPQDIAREADVGNGTFYLHFADKREIFLAFAEEACAEIEAAIIGPLHAPEPWDQRILNTLKATLAFEESERKVIAAALMDLSIIDPGSGEPTVRPRDRLAQLTAESLTQGMERGEIRADLNADLIAHALLGMVEQAAYHAERSNLDSELVLKTLAGFVIAGLAKAP
ncbi:TetR/AcrR family transcriptional regulator [Oleomonas cavernae]|uniref:TetR/AcrR family transcriptional regulator n=1 Tax=Oleomonas cavernae TaxID=2320859 RepID=A0A418WG48_9PROT|nr:TetR/AcrR family transcriptional regulator [Oleomonas cavernae]RJF88987.1 TetR/AcrR family transcriptional regulator [Oleomonas cavernae]